MGSTVSVNIDVTPFGMYQKKYIIIKKRLPPIRVTSPIQFCCVCFFKGGGRLFVSFSFSFLSIKFKCVLEISTLFFFLVD